MNVLDYIILAAVAVGIVFGIIKGFLKLLFSVLGVFVVSIGTAAASPYVQTWFEKSIENEYTRAVVAMLISFIVILVVYILLSLLVTKLLTKNKTVNVVNRLLGGLIGIVMVYMIFAVIIALIINTSPEFLKSIKDSIGGEFVNSWIRQHIYGNNFFGKWIIEDIAMKLLNNITPPA